MMRRRGEDKGAICHRPEERGFSTRKGYARRVALRSAAVGGVLKLERSGFWSCRQVSVGLMGAK